MPVIREPTDFIPNSVDTSQATSREATQASIGNATEVDEQPSSVDVRRPKVISVFCREHQGEQAPAPYSIKPSQLVSV